ncbi:MAG: DUF1565 domain-containing protein [Sphingobacteriales bacterium]|nr:DUF1565 domain-containing protein [Sphingobacteriales bacterium]
MLVRFNATSTCIVQTVQDYCGNVYVSPTGNDANAGGPTNPVATIQQAITLANSSGGARMHIRVLGGTYNVNVPVNLANNVFIEGDYALSGASG